MVWLSCFVSSLVTLSEMMFHYAMVTFAPGGSCHVSFCSQTIPSLVNISVAELISQKELHFLLWSSTISVFVCAGKCIL
jgi:hypothetical protein